MNWYENRALYHNLKSEVSFNSFNDEEMRRLWKPYIIYDNTENNEAVELSEFVKTIMAVTREGEFSSRSGIDVVVEIEVFDGNKNKISMNQTCSKSFQCTYLIHWFPFDTQVSES